MVACSFAFDCFDSASSASTPGFDGAFVWSLSRPNCPLDHSSGLTLRLSSAGLKTSQSGYGSLDILQTALRSSPAVFTSGPLEVSFPHCLSRFSKSLSALTLFGSSSAQGLVSARTVTVAALTRRCKRLPNSCSDPQTLCLLENAGRGNAYPHLPCARATIDRGISTWRRVAMATDGLSFLPTIKCSDCGVDIEISQLADHVCSPLSKKTPQDLDCSTLIIFLDDEGPASPKLGRAATFGEQSFHKKPDRQSRSARMPPPPRIDPYAASKRLNILSCNYGRQC